MSSGPELSMPRARLQVRANAIVIATGATAKRLGMAGEATYWSKGISACAICDGASPLFKNQEVAVVGGGDSATEEAVYLTKYCKHVSGSCYCNAIPLEMFCLFCAVNIIM